MVLLTHILRLLSVLIILAGTQVVSLGNVCVETDGIHVDLSSQHACCDVDVCGPEKDCTDLSLQLEVSNQTRLLNVPAHFDALLFTYAAPRVLTTGGPLARDNTHSADLHAATSPSITHRCIELLV